MTNNVCVEILGVGKLTVKRGENLRKALQRNARDPYQGIGVSCRGLGICGTCEILLVEGEESWPRRSCQTRCFSDMTIQIGQL